MDNKKKKKEKPTIETNKSKIRMILVILFLIVFAGITYIGLRGSYLEYLELGENYTSIFKTNQIYKYGIMAINFVALYFIIYFTNRGIKKGLKVFFEKEKKEMPKLLNKSLALVISSITSLAVSNIFVQKIMLVANSTAFGMQDPIYGLDIA